MDVTAIAAILLAWAVKIVYWRTLAGRLARSDLGSATGLGRFGAVHLLEQPHTEANFLMREMGYRVARKHARRLRTIVHLALFAAPSALIVTGLHTSPPTAGFAAALAVVLVAIGLLVERWLFFAEARHDAMIWYGR